MPASKVNIQLHPTITKPPLPTSIDSKSSHKIAPFPLQSSHSLRARTLCSQSLSILIPSSHLGDPYLHLHLGLPKTTHPLASAPIQPIESPKTSYRLGYETTSARDRHLLQLPFPFPFPFITLFCPQTRDSTNCQKTLRTDIPRLTTIRRISLPKPSELQRRKSHDLQSCRWVYACNRPAASVRFHDTQ